MSDIVSASAQAVVSRHESHPGVRALRTCRPGRPVRDLSLRVPAAERSRLLLLARSDDGHVDAPLGVVRHEVADRARGRGLRSTTWCRSRCRASATSGGSAPASGRAIAGIPSGWRSSTPSSTSSITSIRTSPGSAASSARTERLPRSATARPSSRTSSEMVTQYLTSGPDPEIHEFLRYDFAGLTARYGGVWRRPSRPRRIRAATSRSSAAARVTEP